MSRLYPIALALSLLAAPALAAGTAPAEGPALDPRVEKTLFVANHLYVRGSWFSALVRYEKVVDQGVDDPEVYYRMGYCARRLHRKDEMEKWFGKASPILETRVKEGGSLADHYLLAALRVALGPNDPTVAELARKGIERLDAGKYGSLRKLSGADLFRLARLYSFAGDREQADKTMELSRKKYRRTEPGADDPYAASAFQEGAAQKMAAGDYEAAVPLFEELVKVRSTAPGGYWNLGLARLRTGDVAGARDAWRMAKSNDIGYSTDASYAEALADRIARWNAAHPDERLEVESPYAQASRTDMEALVADETARLSGLYANREANPAPEPAPEPAAEEPSKRKGPKKNADEAEAPQIAPPDPLGEEIARAGAELARLLLAYMIRGYPVREIAMQHRLMGFIFQKTAG